MNIRQIPLELVKPSPMNPRKTFDEADLQELAANIEKQGLLQPITVRQVAGGKSFELVCGERRYRAFSSLKAKEDKANEANVAAHRKKLTRFQSIDAIVREMTDEEAYDAMITENLQRKDVDPIEEAFAFGKLAERGNSAEEIALRFGKSTRFVLDRIKLNALIPELMVEVKEGKMSIAAAMIIARLDEENQHKYYSSYKDNYQAFTKATAERFCDNLFMTIDRSLWYSSHNQADEDFYGDCGCACSECSLNTANHGCLFYEMKAQDSGRCTERVKFQAKTLSFMKREIERRADSLVKQGEPLAFGKTVLSVAEDYEYTRGEHIAALKADLTAYIESEGYELVNPKDAFQSRCYYDADDERTVEMLASGELYRVLRLFNIGGAQLRDEFWYIKQGDTHTNCDTAGTPLQVQSLVNTLRNEENRLSASYAVKGANALKEHGLKSDLQLLENEEILIKTLICDKFSAIRTAIGFAPTVYEAEKLRDYIAAHPEMSTRIYRGFLLLTIYAENPVLYLATPHLDELGAYICPTEYQAAKDAVAKKFDKLKAKTQKELLKLGYGLDGKPLIIRETSEELDETKLVAQVKEKHPDALVLVKTEGNIYNFYGDDAVTAGSILKLNVVPKHNRPDVLCCGFFSGGFDKYLSALIGAGKRVCIINDNDSPE